MKKSHDIVQKWLKTAPKIEWDLSGKDILPPPTITPKQIKALIKYLGSFQKTGVFTYVQFAAILGVTTNSIQKWLTGYSIPTAGTRRLMQLLIACPDLVAITLNSKTTKL